MLVKIVWIGASKRCFQYGVCVRDKVIGDLSHVCCNGGGIWTKDWLEFLAVLSTNLGIDVSPHVGHNGNQQQSTDRQRRRNLGIARILAPTWHVGASKKRRGRE
jgi:hypothetical protein